MVSRYSIIQYVPNPIADERINIGIVAFNNQLVKTRFVKSWKRIRCFALNDSDITLLQEFQEKMQKLASLGLLFSENIEDKIENLDRLNKVAQSWGNSIQFTEPKGSLDDPDTLLKDIVDTLLIEPIEPQVPLFRDRQTAVKVVRKKIKDVLKEFGKDAEEYYKKDYRLTGHYDRHKFDVAVANGKTYFAAQAISFEIQTTEQVISSTSWMISDVKRMQPNIPLGIIILPPNKESPYFEQVEEIYKQSKSTYLSLGAEVVEENNIESWTHDHLGRDFAALVS